jgi:thiol:disulfide interchange protein
MERVTFRDQKVADRVNREFVAVRLDAGLNREAFRRYGGTAVPLTILARPDGTEEDRLTGYRDPADFLAALSAAR